MPTLDELVPLGVLAEMDVGASWAADLESEADKEDAHDGAISAADDLLPSEDQLSPRNPNELFSSTDQLRSPFPDFEHDLARGEDVTADHKLDAADAIDLSEDTDEEIEFGEMRSAGVLLSLPPSRWLISTTSQQAYITSRSYKTVRVDKNLRLQRHHRRRRSRDARGGRRVEVGAVDGPPDEESGLTPVDGSGDARARKGVHTRKTVRVWR